MLRQCPSWQAAEIQESVWRQRRAARQALTTVEVAELDVRFQEAQRKQEKAAERKGKCVNEPSAIQAAQRGWRAQSQGGERRETQSEHELEALRLDWGERIARADRSAVRNGPHRLGWWLATLPRCQLPAPCSRENVKFGFESKELKWAISTLL